MSKKLFPTLMAACFALVQLSAQSKLQDCYDLAAKHHPRAQEIPLIQEGLKLQKQVLGRNYWPQANLNAQATWQSEVTQVPLVIPGLDIPSPARDQYKATLDVQQNIWDGGVTAQQKQLAVANAQVDERRVAVDLYALREQVDLFYFGALLSDRQLAILKLSKATLEAQAKRMQGAVDNGAATRPQLMALQAKLLELDQQSADLLARKAVALRGLGLLTGLPFDENAVLEEPFFVASDTAQNVQRPELELFDAQKSVIAENQDLVRAKNMPKLGAMAQAGYGRPGLNFLSADFDWWTTVGVQVKVPLTQYYTRTQSMETRQLELNKLRLDEQRKAFLLGTEVRLAQSEMEVQRIEKQLSTDAQLASLRKQIRESSQVALDNGAITASDYLSDFNNEQMALQNKALHEVQYLQAISNCLILLGKK